MSEFEKTPTTGKTEQTLRKEIQEGDESANILLALLLAGKRPPVQREISAPLIKIGKEIQRVMNLSNRNT